MTTERDSHRAVRLRDGRVLLVGGVWNVFGYLSSAEIYDPSTDDFSGVGSMSSARINHTATMLGDGRVLVAGGTDGSATLGTADIFDPSISGGTFVATNPMSAGREQHTAARLPNGQVLLAGGVAKFGNLGILRDSAELFDPVASSFEFTHSMITARQLQMTTELGGGRILVAGGMDGTNGGIDEAEVFHKTQSKLVWLLDNLDPDYSTPPFDDSVTVMDSGGSTIAAASGFNICQAGGAYRAISVAPQGDYALVVEFCGSPDRLTRIDPYGGVDYSVAIPDITSVDISENGFAYALVGQTISGDYVAKIDPATGTVVDTAAYGGLDLVVDDSNDVIWIVGDQIRKISRDLTTSHFVVDPITHAAFSVDVASDGSAWVAESNIPAFPRA